MGVISLQYMQSHDLRKVMHLNRSKLRFKHPASHLFSVHYFSPQTPVEQLYTINYVDNFIDLWKTEYVALCFQYHSASG